MKLIFCLLVALCFAVSSACAAFYVNVANAQSYGVRPQYGPFSTYAQAQAFINQNDPSFRSNMRIVGSADGGGNNNGGGYSGPSVADIAAQQAATAKKQRQNEADGLIQQGIDAYNRQAYEAAIQSFQGALEITPDDYTITDWIQKAKDAIAAKKQREQAAFDASKQEGLSQLRGLSQGGSFDSGTGLKGIGSTDSGLKGLASTDSGLKNAPYYGDSGVVKTLPVNTDPMVVDARNVPSGLPKSIDDAIASGYSGAPPGVGDRVRKAFQAIQTHDWKAAKAWFQDALNYDPDNAGLKRLVDLADYTEKFREQKAASTSNVSNKPLTDEEIPADADPRTYALTSGKIHSLEAWKRFIDSKYPQIDPSKLPKDSDIEFLFPGLPALEAKEMNDYMTDAFVKMTENDPELKRTSQPKASQPQQPDSSQLKTIVN
jgi:tetratricopeptide (TPR) repeat protein